MFDPFPCSACLWSGHVPPDVSNALRQSGRKLVITRRQKFASIAPSHVDLINASNRSSIVLLLIGMLIRGLILAGFVCLAGCVQRSDGNVQLGGDEADIIVSVADPVSPIAKGTSAEFVVKVSNAGPHDATNVHVVDVVGVQSNLVSMSCTATGAAECPQPLSLAMLLPTFPKGGALDFHVVLRLADNTTGTIVNSLVATYDFDRNPNNNSVAMDVLVR